MRQEDVHHALLEPTKVHRSTTCTNCSGTFQKILMLFNGNLVVISMTALPDNLNIIAVLFCFNNVSGLDE